MRTLILPGYSTSNKVEAEKIKTHLDGARVESSIRYWKHWDGKTKFSVSQEVASVKNEVGEEKINILSKSIGTLIASHLIFEDVKVNKIILCGIPINDFNPGDEEVYKKALGKIDPGHVLCIQNLSDPHGSYNQIKEFLKMADPQIKVISKEASDHNYPYYQDFIDFLV